MNCNYNPDNNHRPIFEHYINDLCRDKEGVVDKEKMRIIQEYMGAVLSNSDMSRLKLALVLFSLLGNSGKTQLLNLLGLFLGTERIINILIQQMNENSKFTLGSLPDKRLISIGDQTGSEIQDSAIFKQLTGGDPVKIEPKGKQPYSFINSHILLFLEVVLSLLVIIFLVFEMIRVDMYLNASVLYHANIQFQKSKGITHY